MSRRWTVIITLAVACVCLSAADAYAWGPAMHARLALDVLGEASLLPAGLAAMLARRMVSYIFGNIAADVVFAKRMSRVRQFCHHWSTGFRFLEQADNERDQAFAYGYLSHLAADTVAHNKYVPHQITVTRTTMNFGHLYWEMRADALVDTETWRLMEEVLAADHEHHHRVLAAQLTETLLPYRFNRRLFDRINRFHTRDYWQTCSRLWYRYSRWDLPPDLVRQYRAESVERIRSVLLRGAESPVVREDPNGSAALLLARLNRRARRRLHRRGELADRHIMEAAAALAPARAPHVAPPPMDFHQAP
ncbi:MAG TPA: zinc dependent phospholipase C family protein [Phycisphaerae bacterium]|nr:zinc dependent phospholipase C family protein [Phycisphaerales bacterium]HRX83964.1 zinc dependent phospholipase C family protein [Phycisphaerae bacterium]